MNTAQPPRLPTIKIRSNGSSKEDPGDEEIRQQEQEEFDLVYVNRDEGLQREMSTETIKRETVMTAGLEEEQN